MIILPEGPLRGERLASCSDEAQMHFARIVALANGHGRMELNAKTILREAYANFGKQPTHDDLTGWLREYARAHLLFIYKAEDGKPWGQWCGVPPQSLPKWKPVADKRSPEPNPSQIELFGSEYLRKKKRASEESGDYDVVSSADEPYAGSIVNSSTQDFCSPDQRSCTELGGHLLGLKSKALPRIVSLFCGAGGLDLGFIKAGFSIAVALDKSPSAIRTHVRNFGGASHCVDLRDLGPKGVSALVESYVQPGDHLGIIGGPPCQGFSRANTDSHPNDPRNELVGLYLEIIRELKKKFQVEFIVFENVLGIQDAKHLVLYQGLLDEISKLKFEAKAMRLCSLDFGVPQKRNRVIVAAVAKGKGYLEIQVKSQKGVETVREAIGSLAAPAFFCRSLRADAIPVHPNHWTMRPMSKRFSMPPEEWHKGRSFKRTFWDKPSPTIAFGHREIHVHPSCKRRLSIFESLLLQGFPSNFVLEGTFSDQVEQVSNAVPPPVGFAVAKAIKHSVHGTTR